MKRYTSMETRRITLSSINAKDTRYQVRDPRTAGYGEREEQKRNSHRHIQSIVKAITDNPKIRIKPIEVVEDPNKMGQYIIVDGFHRHSAYTKIYEKTKGKRFKQIRVNVHTEGVSRDRALSINTEHTTLSLTSNQRIELQWQQFLDLMNQENKPSKKQTSKLIGITESTVGNWRKLKKQFEEAGFFKKNSTVDKHPITGYPMLRPSREELKKDEWSIVEDDNEGELTENDKALASMILKKFQTADEKGKLRDFLKYYLGEPLGAVDFDIDVDTLDNEYDF